MVNRPGSLAVPLQVTGPSGGILSAGHRDTETLTAQAASVPLGERKRQKEMARCGGEAQTFVSHTVLDPISATYLLTVSEYETQE